MFGWAARLGYAVDIKKTQSSGRIQTDMMRPWPLYPTRPTSWKHWARQDEIREGRCHSVIMRVWKGGVDIGSAG